ncbi:hypothetical protein BEL01nite_60710 [Bradyrhizobium elkanii]|nr:hypothetical protein BEL01nite_60710 [Bradyrhizobium elkanii]
MDRSTARHPTTTAARIGSSATIGRFIPTGTAGDEEKARFRPGLLSIPAIRRSLRERKLSRANSFAPAKSVLRAFGEYVEGDGMCWVGIPSPAADCDLSQDSVRRRLAWLEEIGAIDRT